MSSILQKSVIYQLIYPNPVIQCIRLCISDEFRKIAGVLFHLRESVTYSLISLASANHIVHRHIFGPLTIRIYQLVLFQCAHTVTPITFRRALGVVHSYLRDTPVGQRHIYYIKMLIISENVWLKYSMHFISVKLHFRFPVASNLNFEARVHTKTFSNFAFKAFLKLIASLSSVDVGERALSSIVKHLLYLMIEE